MYKDICFCDYICKLWTRQLTAPTGMHVKEYQIAIISEVLIWIYIKSGFCENTLAAEQDSWYNLICGS